MSGERMDTPLADVRSFLRELRPVSTEHDLIRLGPSGDGGYLVPDDLDGIVACFSPGVADESRFELVCADRGMDVFMADGSVDGPAQQHERFRFGRFFLGGGEDDQTVSLDHWVSESLGNRPGDLMLQMDIEGAEWSVLPTVSDELLGRFRIIVIELHDIDRLFTQPGFDHIRTQLRRILATHLCVHVHPNNCCSSVSRGGITIPRLVEATFVRRDRATPTGHVRHLPHPLDSDNVDAPTLVWSDLILDPSDGAVSVDDGSPKVSVLLTAFDRPEWLRESIESVLQQTYRNWELIILEDNSPRSEVRSIIESYSDPRIITYFSDISDAERYATARYATLINHGFEMSSGDYITYLVDDDMYFADRLEVLVRHMQEHPDHEVAYHALAAIDQHGALTGGLPVDGVRDGLTHETRAYEFVDHNMVIHTRRVFEAVGGWDDDPVVWEHADAHFWARLNAAGHAFYPVDTGGRPLGAKRYHADSVQARIVRGDFFGQREASRLLDDLIIRVVNSDRHPHRFDAIREALAAAADARLVENCERVSAFEAHEVEETDELRRTFATSSLPLRTADVARSLTHLALWWEIAIGDGRPMLVLEDDVVIGPDFGDTLADIGEQLGQLDSMPEVLLLELPRCNDTLSAVPHTLERGGVGARGGPLAYIVTQDGARAMWQLAQDSGMASGVDRFIQTADDVVSVLEASRESSGPSTSSARLHVRPRQPTIEAFITIHDSALIEECERTRRFADVDHTYLFVGPRPVTVSGVKVIRCLDFSPNYEHLPHFYDFTGWYVLATHRLIHTDHAIFLQYDSKITNPELVDRTMTVLDDYAMVSYVPAEPFLWSLPHPGFHERQLAGIEACGVSWRDVPGSDSFDWWPSTQGSAWRTDEFNEFMAWFEPAFSEFEGHPLAGHLAERMMHAFLMSKGWAAGLLPNLILHEGLDSHGTMALLVGDVASFEEKNKTFGR